MLFFLVERKQCDDQKVNLTHTGLFREHLGSGEELLCFPPLLETGPR